MKIKLYIVSYNNEVTLNDTLRSLFDSNIYNTEITIINNHSNFKVSYPVNVIHNSVRPDFSTGHLARDWNCAIINGFKTLKSPDCEILITCQDDTVFANNWLDQTIEYHKTYNFISAGWGDGFCSYLPEAIMNVGLWDERFNTIEYQEADYFNRQKIFNQEKCSINDFHHNRVHNPLFKQEEKSFIWRTSDIGTFRKPSEYNYALLKSKYGRPLEFYENKSYENKQTILYPYFEKDILKLDQIYNTFSL